MQIDSLILAASENNMEYVKKRKEELEKSLSVEIEKRILVVKALSEKVNGKSSIKSFLTGNESPSEIFQEFITLDNKISEARNEIRILNTEYRKLFGVNYTPQNNTSLSSMSSY